jgi:DNA-binding NarL/FixJ family response regulator
LVARAKELNPDVIVADISMPILNGLEAIRQLKKMGIQAKVIILTMHRDVSYAIKAFELGASAFVLKHSAPSELVSAIRDVLHGRVFVSPQIARELVQASCDDDRQQQTPDQVLSARQREVLQLFAEGKSAKEAAAILHISPRTAEFHKASIMKLLGIRSIAEMAQYAVRHGIISN